MSDRAKSISAKQLSGEVQTAVHKVLANHKALTGIKVDPGFVLYPHLIFGFILRKDLSKIPIGELQALAGDVVKALPTAAGTSPAAFIHGGDITLGFVPDVNLTTFHE
jgi:hypothetical protein